MNCDEIKNLFSECESLTGLSQMPDAAAHIKSCAECRAALAYEEKLRHGFASIATEAPPPDLAARIMSIQSEQPQEAGHLTARSAPGWFDQLLRALQGFPFKVALAAGLTGFFAAVLILRQTQLSPEPNTPEIAAQSEQAEPVPARDGTFRLAMSEEKQLPATVEKSVLFKARATEERRKSDKDSMQLAMAPQEQLNGLKAAEPATRQAAAETDNPADERIPGAMTFALDSSEDSFVTVTSEDAVTLADQPAATEPEMQLAMAPATDHEMPESAKPAASNVFAAPPPSSSLRARLSSSQVMSESKSKKFELSNEIVSATEGSDPVANELRELLEANAIDLPEGFISLDELAMRGYLPAEKLRRLRAPTGSGWYLQKTAGQLRIFLKKR